MVGAPAQEEYATGSAAADGSDRRRQRTLDAQVPMEVFIHLMQAFETDEIQDLEWMDGNKSSLRPTRVTKQFKEYQFWLRKPQQLNTFWNMAAWDRPIVGTPWRRGCGAQTLHLSQQAGRRGTTSLLVSSVTGNVSIRLREPLLSLPTLRIVFTVMTMDGNHILWNQDFSARTRASLRLMAMAGRATMLQDPLFPTPNDAYALLSAQPQEDEVWAPHPTMPALTTTSGMPP